jgi:2-phosphosulfolactate phosphatase
MPAITTYLLPSLIPAGGIPGGIAVILDILRASTTIVHALAAGAPYVRPFMEPDEARRARGAMLDGGLVLGGERGGVKIPGFDLGNSPREYRPEVLRDRPVFFTTTNGTRALLASMDADRILVGCFNNLSALVRVLAQDGRPVHLVCAGTRGEVSLEDTLGAGAIASALREPPGLEYPANDATLMALDAWRCAGPLQDELRCGIGGRDVLRLGLDADIDTASAIDSRDVVPELDKATMSLRPA